LNPYCGRTRLKDKAHIKAHMDTQCMFRDGFLIFFHFEIPPITLRSESTFAPLSFHTLERLRVLSR
jgi:hypothetical protein